ncbi:VPS36 [Candida margitis]|uniref:VPS36 n=1 Tax=Candida margitis TaxID=1775924 RepID=UPI002227D642|nr:VPS36 [Candida margitis]KAI5954069.1 VPS36 [Candida margitis]
MSWLKVWQAIKVNRSDRPILEEGEFNVYIKDNVGLYQGKQKILLRQNGRLYLTNKRVIYFDNNEVKNSIAINIEQFTSGELIDRFLRSSPKVKLYLKVETQKNTNKSKLKSSSGFDWVCKICSFKNHVSGEIDAEMEAPKCIACGVPNMNFIQDLQTKSDRASSESAIVAPLTVASSGQSSGLVEASPSPANSTPEPVSSTNQVPAGQCPTCTFINHKSLKFCEMCGTELASSTFEINQALQDISIESNPLNLHLEGAEQYTNNQPYIKISFRKGGESQFFQEVATLIDEIKWENLRIKGGINQNSKKLETKKKQVRPNGAGIHALEVFGEQQRKNNEMILSSSLDDLEQLMFKFEDLIKLSSSFKRLLASKGNNVYNSIPPLNISRTSKLYHSELSRHMSEYLTSFVLTKKSSMITLPDLFAEYNRFLVKCSGFGTELIDVADFKRSIDLFEILNLPVVSNKYEKTGVVVIRPKIHADSYCEFIIEFLKRQEHKYKKNVIRAELIDDDDDDDGGENDVLNHERGCYGATVSEISHALNWSYSVTMEELDKSIDSGQAVLDQNISGTFYYVNKFAYNTSEWEDLAEIQQIKNEIVKEQKEITESLKNEYENSQASNLLNFNPEYEFGTVVEQPKPAAGNPPSHSTIHSLNGLEGLRF